MNKGVHKEINQDFFKTWSSDMAYVLGYFVADGCISLSKDRIGNPYTFNITSTDLEHLYNISVAMGSDYKISKKSGGSENVAHQIQIRNSTLTNGLINMGIRPRKTYNLGPIKVSEKYFADFTRGFFDGDGSVYIYNVNEAPQIKVGFVSVSLSFIKNFNTKLCKALRIPEKAIHQTKNKKGNRMIQYSMCFYIDDSEKLAKFMYGNNPTLYLDRKKEIFDQWKIIKRRRYVKKNYPSKIGWQLKQRALA